MLDAVQCKYSCRDCGLHRVVVTVPARNEESVTEWMDATVLLLVRDHEHKSPRCHPKAFSEVLIPIRDEKTGAEAGQIGGVLK